jgi:hypothetical protein
MSVPSVFSSLLSADRAAFFAFFFALRWEK